jgi:hypothetical protein
MGDSGEGLVDAEARIQERMEELQKSRELAKRPPIEDPEKARKLESLRLARTEMSRQLEATSHSKRKEQLAAAVRDLDRQISEVEGKVV